MSRGSLYWGPPAEEHTNFLCFPLCPGHSAKSWQDWPLCECLGRHDAAHRPSQLWCHFLNLYNDACFYKEQTTPNQTKPNFSNENHSSSKLALAYSDSIGGMLRWNGASGCAICLLRRRGTSGTLVNPQGLKLTASEAEGLRKIRDSSANTPSLTCLRKTISLAPSNTSPTCSLTCNSKIQTQKQINKQKLLRSYPTSNGIKISIFVKYCIIGAFCSFYVSVLFL